MSILKKIIVLLLITPLLLSAEIDIDSVKQQYSVMQNSGIAGREFWVTIPPKPRTDFSLKYTTLYIFSSVKSKVELSREDKNYNKSFVVEPNILKRFELDIDVSEPVDFDTLQIKGSSIYEGSAVNIKSDNPIVVYVAIKNSTQSDTYIAIPTTGSSDQYINMTYYSSNYENVLYPCYTSIISNYDSTTVDITLGGGELEDDEVKFENNEVISTGETASRKLNKGDILLLSANGNLQDISGSRIQSNKPITVLSGNYDVDLPVTFDVKNSKDDLLAMEMSISTWGTAYYFTPLEKRKTPAIFRIYASEDDTKVYKNGDLIGTIAKGGGAGIGESYLEVGTGGVSNNIRLTSISSDKPVALMYYNAHEYDKGSILYHNEPHQLQVPSIEQSVNSAIFTVPHDYAEFTPFYIDNNTVITFPLEDNSIPEDIILVSYDSLGNKLESEKLADRFENNFNIFDIEHEGQKYGSVTLFMNKYRVYNLISEKSKFVTYTYGSGENYSYGLPTGFSIYDKTTDDNQAPDFIFNRDCNGNINFESSKIVDLPLDSSKSSNLADIYIMASENYTFNRETTDAEFIPGRTKEVSWSLKVIDETKPSTALIYAVDKAGNDTILHVESKPFTSLAFDTDTNEINNPIISTYSFQDTLKNPSNTQELLVTRIELAKENSNFIIDSYDPNGWEPGMHIEPNQEIYINYSFKNESLDDSRTYKDSLFIGYGIEVGDAIEECNYLPISELNVMTNFPKYELYSSNDFGTFDSTSQSRRMFDTLQNKSTDRKLFINRVELKHGDKGFSINGYKPSNWISTIPINPNKELQIDIKFDPTLYEQLDQNQVIIDSLGVGISEYNEKGELEEISFNYMTEQIATIASKDPKSSILDDKIFIDYINVLVSSINILPKAHIDGFQSLKIYDLKVNLIVDKNITNLNMINISNLVNGTYFIVLKSYEKSIFNKFNRID